jgi:hypothetical protein
MADVECAKCGGSNRSSFRYCMRCGAELPKVKVEEVNEPLPKKIPQQLDKKKLAGMMVGIAIMIGISFGIPMLYQHFTYDRVMMEAASELNKTCPIMVDKETRFDNAVALPENVFQYNYTLVNVEKSLVDIEQLKQAVEELILPTVKTNPQLKIQREHKTTLNYYYKDRHGEFLFLIEITPDKYE